MDYTRNTLQIWVAGKFVFCIGVFSKDFITLIPLYFQKVCPENAKIHYNIGTLYGSGLNVDDAIDSYMKAIDLHPKYYQAMNNLGNLYKDNISNEKAEFWLRKALDIK